MNWLWSFIDFVLPLLLPLLVVVAAFSVRKQPLWAEAYRRLGRNKVAVAALVVIAVYTGIGMLDSIKWKDNKAAPERTVLDRIFAGVPQERTYSMPFARQTTGERQPHPLKGRHLLGTDGVGNDVLVQTLKGCRTALILGGLTTVIATPLALMFGLLAGYFGKWVDDGIQYFYTVVSSIPSILLLIAMMLVLGRGIDKLAIALGVTSWVTLCRLTRGEVLKNRDREYVRAARALGMSHGRILLKHILPNILPVVMISITLNLSSVMLAEAILSYLQLGVPAGVGSWGNMIDQARLELAREPIIWWNIASASTALFILVLAFNLFGDALRDAIDPRLRSA
jgi:peptide/nickel transport system permease protein